MKARKLWLLALIPLALAACEGQSGYGDGASPPEMEEGEALMVTGSRMSRDDVASYSPVEAASGEFSQDEQNERAASTDNPPNFMAYSYQMALEAPADNVAGLFEHHQAACEAAGPAVCQVMSASLATQNADRVGGRLQIRATPDWLTEFRSGIEDDAESAGGRLLSETTSAEDLSAPILDIRARLTAQTALRDRLQDLLENEGASVEDLVHVERELARVQGDIESATSRLRYLERRVSMSQLAIQYASTAVPIRRTTINPVIAAFNDFFDILARGLGMVIRTIAAILPWLIVIIPVVWFLRRTWRRRMARKAGEKGKA